VKKSLFSLIVLLICTNVLLAQCPCIKVDKQLGCAPLDIVATDCSSGGSSLSYKFDESIGYQSVKTHTYSTDGIYKVIQRGNFTCGDLLGTKFSIPITVTVKPIPVPKISTKPCADNKALIIASDPQYDTYLTSFNGGSGVSIPKFQTYSWQLTAGLSETLDVQGFYTGTTCGGKGTLLVNGYNLLQAPVVSELNIVSSSEASVKFQTFNNQRYELRQRIGTLGVFFVLDTLDNVQGLQTFVFKNLNTTTTAYCFQVRTFDYCGLKESISAEYCTIALSGTALNNVNEIKWNSDPSLLLSNYQLIVNNQNNTGFSSRPNIVDFTDANVTCGNHYCYQLQGNYTDGVKTQSNQVCLKSFSTDIPTTIPELLSTVSDNKILLSWPQPLASVSNYSVFISPNKTNYSFFANSSSNTTLDDGHDPSSKQYCYKTSYTDVCGNTSDFSPITCYVSLRGKVIDTTSRQLFWEPYIGWSEGVKEYVVEKLDESGNTYFSKSIGLLTEYVESGLDTVQQKIRFRIKAISVTGRISYSNLFEVEQKGGFYMPNAFTPNGDGLNDVFYAEGLFLNEFNLEIWNRNGEGVFATKSFTQGWDGLVNSQPAPADSYMYKAEGTDKLGVKYKKSGNFQLIK